VTPRGVAVGSPHLRGNTIGRPRLTRHFIRYDTIRYHTLPSHPNLHPLPHLHCQYQTNFAPHSHYSFFFYPVPIRVHRSQSHTIHKKRERTGGRALISISILCWLLTRKCLFIKGMTDQMKSK